jgi:filamentous hemagglutinin family protein
LDIAMKRFRPNPSHRLGTALLGGLLLGCAHLAWAAGALPTGGRVTAGAGAISQSGNTMTIKQSSSKVNIAWNGFSIGPGNTVTFVQPGAGAIAFNRVTGSDASAIQGVLKANGQVFLSNPNGIVFNATAQVDVGGLVATTHTITETSGQFILEGAGANSIVNQGHITAHDGGTIALVAARVINQGEIAAAKGQVLMGAGAKVTLDLGGPVKIRVDEGVLNALVEQGGAIRADGGLVYLTAVSADMLNATVINHTGITEARTLATGEQGEIRLIGGMDNGDRINVGGTLDVSAPPGGQAGSIEARSAQVQLPDGTKVTTQQDLARLIAVAADQLDDDDVGPDDRPADPDPVTSGPIARDSEEFAAPEPVIKGDGIRVPRQTD